MCYINNNKHLIRKGKKIMGKLKKVILFFTLWIPYLFIIWLISDKILKIDLTTQLAVIGFVGYFVLWLMYFMGSVIEKYIHNKPIQLSSFYKMILKGMLLGNTNTLSSMTILPGEMELVDDITKVTRRKIVIFNVLLYVVTSISLILLIEIENNYVFAIIAIMYAILLLAIIFSHIPEWKRGYKQNIEGIKQDYGEKVYKKTIIAIIITVLLIFIIPIGIYMAIDYITNEHKNQYDVVTEKEEIQVEDDNFEIEGVSEEGEQYIEESIEKVLGGKAVYIIVNLETNLKNENNERYNKITVIANLESDELEKNSVDFIFYQYLTNSELHKKEDMELYTFWETEQIKKGDWYE